MSVQRALLSVSDKTGLSDFARGLAALRIEILSTGGTAATLREAGIAVLDVSEYTGFPEIMDGRVKTLHPKIHGGLLARRGIDEAAMTEHGIEGIDLLVVNLYPFRETIAKPDCTAAEAIENIDIGGPAMLRAAAKNHRDVAVVVDPGDYAMVLDGLQEAGGIELDLRRRLASKAFRHTAAYDATISTYLEAQGDSSQDEWPQYQTIALEKCYDLRYGENPHQSAAFYALATGARSGLARARQIQGKALSFNNIADSDAALQCVRQFECVACVIVKHANPCGVALGSDCLQAYQSAFATDPTSAFGGIIAFNRPLDATTASAIIEQQFVEVLIAPAADPDALACLADKPNLRLLTVDLDRLTEHSDIDFKPVSGGLLAQQADEGQVTPEGVEVVTKRSPNAEELRDLLFAWQVAKYVKSNAIVYCRDQATLGVGAGQMSRVVSARIAAMKAGDEGLELDGAVMASDAFFPFRDGIDSAAGHGIRAVIQPGGSMRDKEVIAAADEHDIAMVFTGMRHFRH